MAAEEQVNSADALILSVLEKNVNGLNSEELAKATSCISVRIRGEAVNRLLSSGKIEMLPGTPSGPFSLRIRKGTQISGASREEQLIYSVIEEAGKEGIWIRHLRDRTGLTQMQMKKCLKMLEQKKLVKAVKGFGTTRKCYILYDLEVDESLTGGTFYSDQKLDSQFVKDLGHICVSMLQSKRKHAEENHKDDPVAAKEFSFAQSSEVTEFVREKGICRVQLSVRDIESVLEVAVLDGAVERRADGMYRAVVTPPKASCTRFPPALVPCLNCPVAKDCKPGYNISPQNCKYFTEWINSYKK